MLRPWKILNEPTLRIQGPHSPCSCSHSINCAMLCSCKLPQCNPSNLFTAAPADTFTSLPLHTTDPRIKTEKRRRVVPVSISARLRDESGCEGKEGGAWARSRSITGTGGSLGDACKSVQGREPQGGWKRLMEQNMMGMGAAVSDST